MSKKEIPTPVEHTVCDLCGEPIGSVRNSGEKVNLQYRRTPLPERGVQPKWFTFAFSYRRRYEGTDRYSSYNGTVYVDWDFHPQCLVDALTPLVKTDAAPD